MSEGVDEAVSAGWAGLAGAFAGGGAWAYISAEAGGADVAGAGEGAAEDLLSSYERLSAL